MQKNTYAKFALWISLWKLYLKNQYEFKRGNKKTNRG